LATTEFAFDNKVYTATNSSPFKANYGKKLRIGFEIRKKGKVYENRKVSQTLFSLYLHNQ